MFDLLDRLKRWFIDLVKSRVFVLMLVFIVLSTILIQRVFVLQIVNGQAYLDDYKLQIQIFHRTFNRFCYRIVRHTGS